MAKFNHNFKEMKKSFDNVFQDRKKQQTDIVRAVILSSLSDVIFLSPIISGGYRSSHQVMIGTLGSITTTVSIKEPFTVLAEGEQIINANVKPKVRNLILFVTNPIAYAWALENGHSKLRPNGIYSIAEDRVKNRWKKITG